MQEDDDPGMGVVKRRRSRKLLESRKVAASPSEGRVTTEAAAAAWGDMLERASNTSDPPPPERSAPPAGRSSPPAGRSSPPAPAGVSEGRPTTPNPALGSGRGPERRSAPPLARPPEGRSAPPSAQPPVMDLATELPRAPLRGMPLSSRPPSALPPEAQLDEPARSSPPRAAPPVVRTPDRRPSGPHNLVIAPLRDLALENRTERRGNTGPDGGVWSFSDPPRQAPPPRIGRTPAQGMPIERVPEGPVLVNVPPPEAQVESPPSEKAPSTLELPAVRLSGRSRPLWIDLTLGVLLLGAGVWTAAVLFDEMARTDRLERVGRALSSAGKRLMDDHPDVPAWLGAHPDPVALVNLKRDEVPRLVEAVAAAGYAPGVFSVSVNEDPDKGQLILEARLPEAVVAYGTTNVWVHPPPETGLVAALLNNATSIVVSFTVPLVMLLGVFVVGRRRKKSM